MAKQEKDQWRISNNHELYQIFDSPEVSKIIKLHDLQWAGNVQRKDNTRVPTRVFEWKTEAQRPVRKAKTLGEFC